MFTKDKLQEWVFNQNIERLDTHFIEMTLPKESFMELLSSVYFLGDDIPGIVSKINREEITQLAVPVMLNKTLPLKVVTCRINYI